MPSRSAGVDVIVATDHDVVNTYERAVADLNVSDRVVVIPGVEATPLVPWLIPPGDTFPRVIGHWMFWPMRYDETLPANGMPWDERAEPGTLFQRMRSRMSARGVMQLNHPTAHSKAGRDEGYFRALGFNPNTPLPLSDDGTAMGMLWRRPGGADAPRNIDWDVQEAMNGSEVTLNLTYREAWFAMLNAGLLRGGTANSDSHSLTVEQPPTASSAASASTCATTTASATYAGQRIHRPHNGRDSTIRNTYQAAPLSRSSATARAPENGQAPLASSAERPAHRPEIATAANKAPPGSAPRHARKMYSAKMRKATAATP